MSRRDDIVQAGSGGPDFTPKEWPMTHETPPQPEPLPTFARTGVLTHHDLGCRCWPHVSERDALDAIAAVGLAEYRDGVAARLPVSGESEGLREAATPKGPVEGWRYAAALRALHGAGLTWEEQSDGVRKAIADAAAVNEPLLSAAWAAVDWLEGWHTDQAEGDAATATRLRSALTRSSEARTEPEAER